METLKRRKLELEVRKLELEVWEKENSLGVEHIELTQNVHPKPPFYIYEDDNSSVHGNTSYEDDDKDN
ncbi:hypothetical protein LSTR_LSTR016043 [Laodelphax striatellus]|nr:hypothetical protein LSTR_LSTR016043 [Laodelphax striatellus]